MTRTEGSPDRGLGAAADGVADLEDGGIVDIALDVGDLEVPVGVLAALGMLEHVHRA